MGKAKLNAKSETESSLGEMSLPLVNNKKHQSEAGAQGGSKETAADGRVGNVSDMFG